MKKSIKKYGGQYTKRKYSVKTKYISALKKHLDRLVQEVYVVLNPVCFACEDDFTSEMHHFVPKAMSFYLRFRESNLIPLCQGCHFVHHFQGNPLIHATIIKRKGWKWYDKIQEDSRILLKPTVEDLEQRIKELEVL